MSASAIICRPNQILGKRRADDSHSLALCSTEVTRLSSPSDIHRAPVPVPSKHNKLVIVNGKLQIGVNKRYQCTHEGCDKAYSKPSRLAEHERSHTGERPYQCKTCRKSYLRETHLHAHARSHLPESSRPFICDRRGCEKRFWTMQHLKVHIGWHEGVKPFTCTGPECTESFAKHHQLRSHIASAHSPPGTKPYRCDHATCTKSFSTNQQLKAHLKTHDEKRYTCVHNDCVTTLAEAPIYFPTWSALQNHIRNAHPPTCTHPSCTGRIFTTQKGLRAHMKLHEQHYMAEALRDPSDDEADHQPAKKRRGGDWGRDWMCDSAGCTKDFKSKKALAVHRNVTHLGQRNFICPYESCQIAYGYKHLLQRHMAKAHERDDHPLSVSDNEEKGTNTSLDIDAITGCSYIQAARARVAEGRALRCPFPDLHPFTVEVIEGADVQPPAALPEKNANCDYTFRRGYDLRRHLRASHGFFAQKDSVELWVAQKKLAWYT